MENNSPAGSRAGPTDRSARTTSQFARITAIGCFPPDNGLHEETKIRQNGKKMSKLRLIVDMTAWVDIRGLAAKFCLF
jgi:hypothetical protein